LPESKENSKDTVTDEKQNMLKGHQNCPKTKETLDMATAEKQKFENTVVIRKKK